jgi:hypothetical protein
VKISLVRRCDDTKTRDYDAHSAIVAIRYGRWKKEVELVREAVQRLDKAAAEKNKKQLPALTWSGRFKRRAGNGLIEHSGLLCADIDNVNGQLASVREKLARLPQVFALFVSPSATGLKVLVRVPADAIKHLASFRAVRKLIHDATGLEIDASGKDIARLCFVSYDPDLYYNQHAIELEPLPEPPDRRRDVDLNVNLVERQRIAVDLLGPIDWQSETHGFLPCPGKHLHTTGDGERDCAIDFDKVPTVHCFHSHCHGILDGINRELRSRIGKVEYGKPESCARDNSSRAKNSACPPKAETEPKNEAAAQSSAAREETDEQSLQRLAALSPLEYDRVRIEEAQRLRCRPVILDKIVESRRVTFNSALQGHSLQLNDVELWPEPVNGVDVLNEISETIAAYVVMSKSSADLCAVWCAHAHRFRAFTCSPRLHITSPAAGCGKTTLRDVIALFTSRSMLTENLSVAVLFRIIEKIQPTLLADECDAWLRDNDELRGMLNAGHRRDGQALRCEGESYEVRAFNVFAPVVLCGIGALPGTLHDRSISVRLERAKPDEIRKRFDSYHVEKEKELCRKLARFCVDNTAKIEACDPKLPDGVFNRLADNWRPLFAIAEVAGGDWPQRVATALFELTNDADVTAQGIGTTLLADIKAIFENETVDRLHSETIASDLAAIEGGPWAEWGRSGKPISKNQIAKQLKRFGVEPRDVRIADTVLKGYLLEQFKEAFERYLPADPLFQNATTLQTDDFSYEKAQT